MPVGDCERAFRQRAADDGIDLDRARAPWLNQRGHFELPADAESVVPTLSAIFDALGGDPTAQRAKRTTSLPGDFVHPATGTFIEIDESQHFTSFRLIALDLYPEDTQLGFDRGEYVALCRRLAPTSDRYRQNKDAVGFGAGGRQRQRAYHDALRDLVTPELGHPPVIRVAAPDRDGAAAYERVQGRLQALLG
jgi:hypothetical protein